MAAQLRLRPAALADLREAHVWYDAQLPGLGLEFMDAIEQRLMQVQDNPLQFPVVRHEIRRAIVRRFPYSIFFVAKPSLISVLAVMHHSRAPVRWQSRA